MGPQCFKSLGMRVEILFHLLCFALTRWGASRVQFSFFLANEPIWFAPSFKRKRNCGKEAPPQSKGPILKYRVPCFWPSYIIHERRTTFAKAYGIKVRCYWELFGEHVKNLGNSLLWTHPLHPTNKFWGGQYVENLVWDFQHSDVE